MDDNLKIVSDLMKKATDDTDAVLDRTLALIDNERHHKGILVAVAITVVRRLAIDIIAESIVAQLEKGRVPRGMPDRDRAVQLAAQLVARLSVGPAAGVTPASAMDEAGLDFKALEAAGRAISGGSRE